MRYVSGDFGAVYQPERMDLVQPDVTSHMDFVVQSAGRRGLDKPAEAVQAGADPGFEQISNGLEARLTLPDV